jgi:pimeloyl-ACP methyl ester carboxylesterase
MPFYLVTCPFESEEPHRIHYQLVGADSAPYKIIFTMGLGGTAAQWEPQVAHFASRPDSFQVLTYDNRGVGLSDQVSGRWTTKKMAKDALKLLDHVGWRTGINVVGLSMGGMISQELVRLEVKRFSSLVLLSTIAGGALSLKLFILTIPTGLQLAARTFLTTDPRTQLKNGLRLLYPEEYLDMESPHPVTGEMTKNFKLMKSALVKRGLQDKLNGVPGLRITSVIKQALAVFSHSVRREEFQAISQNLHGNVAVLTGDADILVHPANAERLREDLQAGLLIVPGAGHGANEQEPALVNSLIERVVINSGKRRCLSRL